MLLLNLTSPATDLYNIIMLLQIIITKHLPNTHCLTIVSDQQINIKHNLSFIYLTPEKTVEELANQLLLVSDMGCSDYIVHMSDLHLFMTAFDIATKRGSIRRSDRKLLLVPVRNNKDESLQVFAMRESGFVADILLILYDQTVSNCVVFELYTHAFMKAENNTPVFLDRWDSCSQKFQKKANLFPHDIKNLNGKTLKIASFTYKPYCFLELDPSIAPSGRDGLELRTIDVFCSWVNCTVEIINENENQWGEILTNTTGVGVIGRVFEDHADMGMSALYSWYEEYVHLDFSSPSIRSVVTCLAPSPKLRSSWTMPLLPFHPYMWFAVIFTFICSCITLTLAKGSVDIVLLTVFGIMVSQSQPKIGETWYIRRVTGWLLVGSLVLISAYGAGLASTFTVPQYEPSIDTIQDLVDRRMEWGATHDAWVYSLTMSNEPLIKQLVKQFRIKSAAELKARSFTGDMAFSIEKLPAGYFAIGDYITKEALLDLTVMLENFYYEQCVVMLRKSSPYTKKLSTLIGRLHQSGLMLSWETQVALKYLNYKVQLEVKLSRSKNDVVITALSLRHLVGIFGLYFAGVLIAFVIFIGECVTKKFQQQLKILETSIL